MLGSLPPTGGNWEGDSSQIWMLMLLRQTTLKWRDVWKKSLENGSEMETTHLGRDWLKL